MRTDNSNMSAVKGNACVKALLSVAVSVFFMLASVSAFSLIILKTDVPESIDGAVMVTVSALTAVLMSALLTLSIKTKPIFCALCSLVLITALRVVLTLLTVGKVSINLRFAVTLAFCTLFCIVGALIGAAVQK